MAKSDELVKYITQRVVTYIDKPKAVRRMERQSRKKPKEPWAERWFGMLPMALGLWAKQVRGENQKGGMERELPMSREHDGITAQKHVDLGEPSMEPVQPTGPMDGAIADAPRDTQRNKMMIHVGSLADGEREAAQSGKL